MMRRRWWVIYMLLLGVSLLVQWWQGDGRAHRVDTQQRMVDIRPPHRDNVVRLAYRDQGRRDPTGDTIVLLHGSPGSKRNFDRLTPLLVSHFRVITVDLPGFGESTHWVGDYSIEAHGRDVLALMDALHIDRAHVLGFSMGSGVATYMATLQPDRIKSLIFLGGIGIQQGEGSGDYYFEHLKYALGYAALVVAPELVPHFGLFGQRWLRHSFIRNFYDTDQRPLRAMLQSLAQPVLILHGRDDPLVPAWVAIEHHAIIPRSKLVMFDASHFMVFSDAGCRKLIEPIITFLRDGLREPLTVDHTANKPRKSPILPIDLKLRRHMSPWAKMGAIITGTFILEDPTSIAVGLLIRDGQLDLFVGVLAVFVGIFLGDLGLYMMGRFAGRAALRWKPVAKWLPVHTLDSLGKWFDRRGWKAVLVSRFVPGMRLPLYVAAGVLGNKPWRFMLWTCMAVMVWVPTIVLIVIVFGEAATTPFQLLFGRGWVAVLAAIGLLLVLMRVILMGCTRVGRARLAVDVARLWRWEFWPMWAFYAPLVPWVVYLMCRYRGFATLTVVNPAMPQSGFVGESKIDILNQLPNEWVASSALLRSSECCGESFDALVQSRGWSYPLIIKPNEAQRGAGVKLVRDRDAAVAHLQSVTYDALVQTYHPGPFEAGVFYYRMPCEANGHVFTITDKHFPTVTGDGKRTLEQLIWADRRLRMQAMTFLLRHEQQRDRVLGDGEVMQLAVAGNHCQGTLFRDGAHLITPALETRIDNIAKQFDGFYFGRFDVRYTDVDAFKRGDDLTIIELNGVMSEATNIYDPAFSLYRAQSILRQQWLIAFQIGDQNRRRGAAVTPLWSLLKMIRSYYRQRTVNLLSD